MILLHFGTYTTSDEIGDRQGFDFINIFQTFLFIMKSEIIVQNKIYIIPLHKNLVVVSAVASAVGWSASHT